MPRSNNVLDRSHDATGLDVLLKDASRGKFDVVMAWSVDRLGCSLADLAGSLQELNGARCDLFLHQQGIDTTSPASKAMFQMLGVFAEFERAMIQARVEPRRKRRSWDGTISPETDAAIRDGLAVGIGKVRLGRQLGVGTMTVAHGSRVRCAMLTTDRERAQLALGGSGFHSCDR